mgnify:CR=1 FL=1
MSQPSGSGSENLSCASKTLAGEAGPESAPPSASVLEHVLQATLAICARDEPLQGSDMERLRAVARRHPDCRELTEPIAAELVRAVLGGNFLRADDADGVGPAAVAQIARSLLEDPAAGPRLQRFWDRLIGEAS